MIIVPFMKSRNVLDFLVAAKWYRWPIENAYDLSIKSLPDVQNLNPTGVPVLDGSANWKLHPLCQESSVPIMRYAVYGLLCGSSVKTASTVKSDVPKLKDWLFVGPFIYRCEPDAWNMYFPPHIGFWMNVQSLERRWYVFVQVRDLQAEDRCREIETVTCYGAGGSSPNQNGTTRNW